MTQRPETDSAAARAAARPRSREADGLLEGEKASAMLLFSGVALVLLGVTFTFMGWRYHQSNATFEWLKLLGPVLISVGATFALVSVCNFGTNFSCCGGRRGAEDVLAMAATEQSSRGHCCATSGRNHPIVIHDVAAILRAPPEYNFIVQDAPRAADLQACGCGVHASLPPPSCAAFPSEGRWDASGNRCEKAEGDAARPRPPAYEDIYPSFNACNLP